MSSGFLTDFLLQPGKQIAPAFLYVTILSTSVDCENVILADRHVLMMAQVPQRCKVGDLLSVLRASYDKERELLMVHSCSLLLSARKTDKTGSKHLDWLRHLATTSNVKELIARREVATKVSEATELGQSLLLTNMASFAPSDVCLVFPVQDSDQFLELWTTRPVLQQHIEHFQGHFDADFAEANGSVDPTQLHGEDGYDSDHEADTVAVSRIAKEQPKDVKSLARKTHANLFEIPMRSIRYSTMRAILFWLLTGKIKFATLRSIGGLSEDDKQLDLIPVSPKSTYSAATYLGLPVLADLALKDYERQLTLDVIEQETTSELYMLHAPVRKMVLRWIGAHYKA